MGRCSLVHAGTWLVSRWTEPMAGLVDPGRAVAAGRHLGGRLSAGWAGSDLGRREDLPDLRLGEPHLPAESVVGHASLAGLREKPPGIDAQEAPGLHGGQQTLSAIGLVGSLPHHSIRPAWMSLERAVPGLAEVGDHHVGVPVRVPVPVGAVCEPRRHQPRSLPDDPLRAAPGDRRVALQHHQGVAPRHPMRLSHLTAGRLVGEGVEKAHRLRASKVRSNPTTGR